MVSLLSELLANKGKPIIYNGKLLLYGRQLIFAREDKVLKNSKYRQRTIFTTTSRNNKSGGSSEINLTEGIPGTENEEGKLRVFDENLLIEMLLNYDRSHAEMWLRDPDKVSAAEITVAEDLYTHCIVLESELYRKEMDPSPTGFHRVDRQYNKEAQLARAKMLLEYIDNYFDIYLYLFNRRLMNPYMSPRVKGHLVAGFFQPLMCSTALIRTPLSYPCLSFVSTMIHGDSPLIHDNLQNIEIILEPSDGPSRGLYLSCASMYDICRRFFPISDDNAMLEVPQQMDKRVFMFIFLRFLSYIVAGNLDLDIPIEKNHPTRTRDVDNNPLWSGLLHNMKARYNELSSQIAVI